MLWCIIPWTSSLPLWLTLTLTVPIYYCRNLTVNNFCTGTLYYDKFLMHNILKQQISRGNILLLSIQYSGAFFFFSLIAYIAYLRHPVALKRSSGSWYALSGPVVQGRITRSIRTGKALFSKSGFRLSEEDKFHKRPGKEKWNSVSIKC